MPPLKSNQHQNFCIGQATSDVVDNTSLLRLDPDEKLKLDEQDSILLNSSLTLPKTITEVFTKSYFNKKFIDPSIIKNTKHKDVNDKNITNARFIQVNQCPQIDSPLTPNLFVDNALDQFSLVRKNHDTNFNNHNLAIINSITLNKQAKMDKKLITKVHVDPFHQENERSRRNLGIEFYDESSDLVKKTIKIMISLIINY